MRVSCAVRKLMRRIEEVEQRMSDQIDQLGTAVSENAQATQDAIARVQEDVTELQREVSAQGNDPRLNELVARVQASTEALKQVNPLPDFPAADTSGTGADSANDGPTPDGSGNVTPEGDTEHDAFGNPL